RPPRLHACDTRSFAHVRVLDCVDLLDERRCDGPCLDRRRARVRLDQGDPGSVRTRNGSHREFRYVPQGFTHRAGARDDPGHTEQPGMQVDLVGFDLLRRQLLLRPRAAGLSVVVGHRDRSIYAAKVRGVGWTLSLAIWPKTGASP